MVVPGDEWSLHMYCRLRTRFDDTILRFDVNNYTVVMTATHLLNLVAAIKSLVKSANWRMMRSRTRLEYFGLVLDILRNTVARDNDRRPARSSPYALETTKDHNLYLQMIASGRCAHTINLLHELFTKLQSPIDHNQADQIRSLLDEIVAKDNRYRKSRVPGVPLASEDSAIRIRRLAAGESTDCSCFYFTPTDMVTNSYFPPAVPRLMSLLTYKQGCVFLLRMIELNGELNGSRPSHILRLLPFSDNHWIDWLDIEEVIHTTLNNPCSLNAPVSTQLSIYIPSNEDVEWRLSTTKSDPTSVCTAVVVYAYKVGVITRASH
jgi:hypothetical protein